MTCNNRINSELWDGMRRYIYLETVFTIWTQLHHEQTHSLDVKLTVSYGNRVEYVNVEIYIYITLLEKLDLHQIYSVQIWCKKVQTKVK